MIKKILVWDEPRPAGLGAVNWGKWHYLEDDDESPNVWPKGIKPADLENGWHQLRPTVLVEIRLNGKYFKIYKLDKNTHEPK